MMLINSIGDPDMRTVKEAAPSLGVQGFTLGDTGSTMHALAVPHKMDPYRSLLLLHH